MQEPPKESSQKARRVLLVCGSLIAILASAIWIYRTEFVGNGVNLRLHETLGRVMAEQTARLVGHHGKVVVITASVPDAPELKVQVEAFEKDLQHLGGFTVSRKIVLASGDNAKYRPGAGLSAKRFLKIVRKNVSADAIVSFVGAPRMSDVELQQLKAAPKFLAETHSPEKLINLFQQKALLLAIVPRYQFPAPGPRKPQTGQQWFDRYFQILAPDSALPVEDASP